MSQLWIGSHLPTGSLEVAGDLQPMARWTSEQLLGRERPRGPRRKAMDSRSSSKLVLPSEQCIANAPHRRFLCSMMLSDDKTLRDSKPSIRYFVEAMPRSPQFPKWKLTFALWPSKGIGRRVTSGAHSLEDLEVMQAANIQAIVAMTVFLSVMLHGLSAAPFSARFGRWSARSSSGS